MKTEKSLMDIISGTKRKLKGKCGELMGASILTCTAIWVFSLFMPPVGLLLSLVVGGIVSLGFTTYVIALLNDEETNVETCFSKYKFFISAFVLRSLQLLFIFLWSLLLIVPGIICALNYSFAFCVMSENNNITAVKALNKSKEIVYGHRVKLLLIYLYIFIAVLLIFAAATLIPYLISLLIALPIWSLFVISAGITFIVWGLVISPFSKAILANYYIEIKTKNATKRIKKNKQSSVESGIPTVEDVETDKIDDILLP